MEITHLADALAEAYLTRRPIDPPLSSRPGLTIDEAYQIQLRQVARWMQEGRTIQGHKIGLTSLAMQRQLGVDQPDFGHLTDAMFELENVAIPHDRYLQPRIEPEIAFVLKRDLAGPGVNVAQAISAVDYALPALEIIDSRVRDWKITIADTIADNASSGGAVLGSHPVALGAVDLRTLGCVLRRNGDVVETGAGGAVLGSPLNALVWLANELGRLGTVLPAGSVVLSGSLTRAVDVAPGDVFSATFPVLGSVTATFACERK